MKKPHAVLESQGPGPDDSYLGPDDRPSRLQVPVWIMRFTKLMPAVYVQARSHGGSFGASAPKLFCAQKMFY